MAQLEMTFAVGSKSLADHPAKLEDCKVELFHADGYDAPLVAGSSAWLICKVIPEPHIQQTYDLFIGEVVAAFADARVFRNGHWEFETAGPDCVAALHRRRHLLCDRREGGGQADINPGSDLTFGHKLNHSVRYGKARVQMSDLTPD